jgi:ribosomal protein S25
MSFLDRRMELLNSIANVYSSKLQTTSYSKVRQQIVSTILNCGGVGCVKCLDVFMNPAFRTGTQYHKNLPFINYIRKGVCAGACFCDQAITVNNSVIFSGKLDIKAMNLDFSSMAKEVEKKMINKFGGGYSRGNNQKIVQIMTSVSGNVQKNINQSVFAAQIIRFRGAGEMKGVNMSIVINAVMKAIIETKGSLSILTTITDSMITRIKKEVDKNLLDLFAYVWRELKVYIITVFVFIIILMTLMVALLIYNAYKN